MSEVEAARGDHFVHVRFDVPDDLPPAWADRERIHQVLFNLLDNAVRFTPPGGEVTVSAAGAAGRCEVRVADTGPGIPPEHMPFLFERFYRVDQARSRGDGGTGIGLAIARSVVEAHGGRIRAESEVGRGSVFTFELPLAMTMLGLVGIVTPAFLNRNRFKFWLGIFVGANFVTPGADPFTPLLLTVPLILLFEASIQVIRALRR